MALVFTFPCGGCGRRYSLYYPKALLYELSGTGTRQMGESEDEAERQSGAIEAARKRAESVGNIWVNAAEIQSLVCECGKKLDMNIAHHPRVPQTKGIGKGRQTGFIGLSGTKGKLSKTGRHGSPPEREE